MVTSWILATMVCLVADEPRVVTSRVTVSAEPFRPNIKYKDTWELTLGDALRIGLKHLEMIRIVAPVDRPMGKVEVEPAKADLIGSKFESALQAHLRSVEQQYWAVRQQESTVKAREKAAATLADIVRAERKKHEAGADNGSDLTEAGTRLERADLATIMATSDAITVERQLRNLLGVPPADGRRIVAATAPVEARIVPDWKSSAATMATNNPDRIEARQALTRAERSEEGLRNLKCLLDSPTSDPVMTVLEEAMRRAHEISLRRDDLLHQVDHQTTHSLARFFLEVDANYEQYRTARRLREAASTHLDETRTAWATGKAGFAIERLLDAVSQEAELVAQVAQYLAAYNTSLASLAEMQGTLPADRGILVSRSGALAGESHRAVAGNTLPCEVPANAFGFDLGWGNVADAGLKRASLDLPAASPVPTRKEATTIQYQFSIERGGKTTRIEGTITTEPKP